MLLFSLTATSVIPVDEYETSAPAWGTWDITSSEWATEGQRQLQ